MKNEGGTVSQERGTRRGPGKDPGGVRLSPPAAGRALRGLGSACLALCLGLGGVFVRDAFAQSAPKADGAAVASDALDLSPPEALSDQPEAGLSVEERVGRATQFVASIEQSAQSILRQLQTARKDRDVVRVLCLNDKLNQVDVALRSAQDRVAAVRAAAERGDIDRTRHEYTVLEVLNDRVRVLVNESNQCVGEETGFIGEAEVSVSVDPNLPNADTGFESLLDVAPPPLPEVSSPTE
jgi:hypothetical protein